MFYTVVGKLHALKFFFTITLIMWVGAISSSPVSAALSLCAPLLGVPAGSESLQLRIPEWPNYPRFSELMYQSVEKASLAISKSEIHSITELLDYIASDRREIARILGDSKADEYGRPRTGDSYSTWLMPRYESFQQDALKAAESMPKDSDGVSIRVMAIPGTKKRVQLTGIHILTAPGRDSFFSWHHTDSKYIAEIVLYTDQLYKKALDQKNSQIVIINTVAEIHWWLAHAMPYA